MLFGRHASFKNVRLWSLLVRFSAMPGLSARGITGDVRFAQCQQIHRQLFGLVGIQIEIHLVRKSQLCRRGEHRMTAQAFALIEDIQLAERSCRVWS